MRGRRLEWTWLLWLVLGTMVVAMAACAVATPGVPTAIPSPTATLKRAAEPVGLVILYTSHAEGVVLPTEAGDD